MQSTPIDLRQKIASILGLNLHSGSSNHPLDNIPASRMSSISARILSPHNHRELFRNYLQIYHSRSYSCYQQGNFKHCSKYFGRDFLYLSLSFVDFFSNLIQWTLTECMQIIGAALLLCKNVYVYLWSANHWFINFATRFDVSSRYFDHIFFEEE